MRSKSILLLLWLLALAMPRAGQIWAQEKKDAPPPLALKVGDQAPDFELLDTNLQHVKLSSFRGKKNVALAFYIFAFTGG
jgi:hypothetical protein